jgi:spore coat polysaccharide biosynthesis protein SpsF (cytidylyltransferase family)
MSTVLAIVQARMTSQRFPGKVLATFKGRPILDHVLAAVEAAVPRDHVTIATSTHPADDAIEAFARQRGTTVARGDLDNVLLRFQQAARLSASDWILRINADSPLHDPEVIRRVIAAAAPHCDVVTTIQPRTFPKGRNAEIIRRAALLDIDAASASKDEQEHVTAYFYNRPDQYTILNIESGHPEWAAHSLVVDTASDLARLEAMTDADLDRFRLEARA